MEQGNSMISILHPSRQRPELSRRTIEKWLSRAKNPVEVIISLDEDDPTIGTYEINNRETGAKIIINRNRSAVDAINTAAKAATGQIFIVVSDDTDCPNGWDRKIINSVMGRTDWILKTDDGIQRWIITMPVMDRVYYERFGYIYYPEYKHMFVDTDLTCVADLTCRKIYAPLKFPHLHYSTGQSEKDAVNEKADATWTQGETLFRQRAKMNFGINAPKCKIQNRSIIQRYMN
jgi:glycosyltransferase involved in cell wall biosynthesis